MTWYDIIITQVKQMKKEGGINMNEREKEIMKTIERALPHMTEFDKGYILCMAEKSEEREENMQVQQ